MKTAKQIYEEVKGQIKQGKCYVFVYYKDWSIDNDDYLGWKCTLKNVEKLLDTPNEIDYINFCTDKYYVSEGQHRPICTVDMKDMN